MITELYAFRINRKPSAHPETRYVFHVSQKKSVVRLFLVILEEGRGGVVNLHITFVNARTVRSPSVIRRTIGRSSDVLSNITRINICVAFQDFRTY
jgi:hypothetical protein